MPLVDHPEAGPQIENAPDARPAIAPPGSLCRHCLHAVTHIAVDGVCPECGKPVRDGLDPEWFANRPLRRARAFARAACWLFPAMVLAAAGVIAECALRGVYQSGMFAEIQLWKAITSGPAEFAQLLGWLVLASYFRTAIAFVKGHPGYLKAGRMFSLAMVLLSVIPLTTQSGMASWSVQATAVYNLGSLVFGCLALFAFVSHHTWLARQCNQPQLLTALKFGFPAMFLYAAATLLPAMGGLVNIIRFVMSNDARFYHLSRSSQWFTAGAIAAAFLATALGALATHSAMSQLVKAKRAAS